MKQKDWALIVVIVVVSAILSLFISKAIFVTPTNRQQSVESVQPISSDFPTSSIEKYVNGGFDPTQLIQISPNNNSNPFNSSSTNQ